MQKNYSFNFVRLNKNSRNNTATQNELPSEFAIQQILRYAKAIESHKTSCISIVSWVLN